MLRERRFPAWMVRRSYFKRVARWAKPGKPHRPSAAHEAEPDGDQPCNVLTFPASLGGTHRDPVPTLRSVGSA